MGRKDGIKDEYRKGRKDSLMGVRR